MASPATASPATASTATDTPAAAAPATAAAAVAPAVTLGSGGERRLRADAARNHQRLIDAAAEVFAARGLDATLDEIARHAGVNVATAYRHFANKHELAREFLDRCVDRAASIISDAAAEPDPRTGLAQLLERCLAEIAANRALVDMLARSYGGEHFEQLLQRTAGPLERLLARARVAGVVRAEVAATDFPPILEMLSAIASPGGSSLPYRYIALILAGLRPAPDQLPCAPPTPERLLQAAAARRAP